MGQPPGDPQPIPLNYGRRAPIWRRRKMIVAVGAVVGGLVGGYLAQQPVRDWLELRAYRREAAQWYAAGLTWSEPPTKLKYTENPADAPGGKFERSYSRSGTNVYTGYRSFGGAIVDRRPLFTGDGKPILAGSPDEVMLFMHQRTSSAGLTRLIGISNPRFFGDKLSLQIDQIGLLNGDYRILRGNSRDLDMAGVAGPGEIRLFAGQADPTDPARFSIPFEARGRTGFIDGMFQPGQSFSKDPAAQKIEQEANSNVMLTIRMSSPASRPTTQP